MKKERLTKRLALFTALTLTGAMLAGCGNTDAAESSSDAQTGVTADTQASAGDASADVVDQGERHNQHRCIFRQESIWLCG